MKELIAKLEELGFTVYESKVFIAMTKGFNMSAPEVAEDAGIPKSSAYDILKLFAERGYCNEVQTPSKLRYEMVSPEIVKGKIENELDFDFNNKLKKLNSSFEELIPLYKSSYTSDGKVNVELIKGFNKYRFVKFLDLMKESNKEMLLMNKLEGHVSQDLDAETKNFFKRGGKIKSIYEASTDFKFEKDGKWEKVNFDDLILLCESFEKKGEEIRLSEKVPQNIAIFDKEIVFTSLTDSTVPKNNRTDVIIRNTNYADYMIELFELHWSKAVTVEDFKKLKRK